MSTAALAAEHNREEYAKAVCHFLSEMIRTRKISLTRAAEIAEKVVQNINLVNTEADFLKLVKELKWDFEELQNLEDRLNLSLKQNELKRMEDKVRDFVIQTMPHDPKLANDILQAAINEGATSDLLCAKFEPFKIFLENSHE